MTRAQYLFTLGMAGIVTLILVLALTLYDPRCDHYRGYRTDPDGFTYFSCDAPR